MARVNSLYSSLETSDYLGNSELGDRPELVVPVGIDRDEHVPGEEGSDAQPVEDDVDHSVLVTRTLALGFDLFHHFVCLIV